MYVCMCVFVVCVRVHHASVRVRVVMNSNFQSKTVTL